MKSIRTAMAAQINASASATEPGEDEIGSGLISVAEAAEFTLGAICPEQTKRPYCPECGHHDVFANGPAEWCTLTNDWVLKDESPEVGGCCECEATWLKSFDWFTDAEHTAHWQAKLDEKGKELALSVDKDQGVLYRTEQLPNGGVKLFLKLTEKGKISFAREMNLPSAYIGSFAAISLGD